METVCTLWNRRWTTEQLSRVLVLLTVVLLFVMPVTEYFCDWDHFLRGGPDVEFSALAWLLFAAMIVLTMNGTFLRPKWIAIFGLMRAAGDRCSARGDASAAPGHLAGPSLSAGREIDSAPTTFPPLRI